MKIPSWPDPQNSNVINLGLDRVFNALEKLGNPHLKLPPVIHVAGTNGKGSTIAFLRAMMEAAGKKCHVYTSPHLVNFNERIFLAGENISDDFLNEVIDETKNKCGDIPLTFFEGTTVAALLAFSKVKADYVILETGMGGRLDATNVVPNPALTIITPISLDHVEFLGDTIEKIALEKASIMKDNVPCISSVQNEAALKVITNMAKEMNSKLSVLEKDFFYMVNTDNSFIYRDENGGTGYPKTALRGKHQCMNAALAVRAALELGIEKKDIKAGIKGASWPARMQKLEENVFLDGGHNEQAGEVICDFVKEENAKKKKHNIAVIAMRNTKDFTGFIKNLAPAFNEIYVSKIPNEELSRDPMEIKKVCDELKVKCRVFKEFDEALATSKNGQAALNNRVVICGSLYLAGYVLDNL